MIRFISDTHAFHEKMLEIRGYKSVEEMTVFMASQINSVVEKNDTLVHCGDWSFGSVDNARRFREMISCQNIWLTKGNHDQRFCDNKKFTSLFAKVQDTIMIETGKTKVFVFHYPVESWPSMNYGTLHVHGHCHHQIRHMKRRFNACVDVNGFVPISVEDLDLKLKEQNEPPGKPDTNV